ncbi:MAG: response regulator [Bacteroidetes bacterium]|nr:response regulator [Bacteroidota bacterium]MBI3483038.1 response regulator [Bacteroidota bacterium]
MKENEVEILLAEDTPSDAELTIRALKKSKMANHITHVEDGLQAVNFLLGEGEYEGRNTDNKPKVILLDLKMPKLNGIEVLRKIKSDERTKRIPVVVLTSSKEDPDINTCYDLGASSYIVKPVAFEDFIKVVTNIGMYWLLVNNSSQ